MRNKNSKHAHMLLVLYEASDLFKLKFILETHSEYMIRKWQVLVAKDKMPKEQVSIYYLEEEKDKNVVPRRIAIEGDGSLSDRFGEGFFDEADNQAMQLFRAQKEKS
ncbi:MAG: DUF3696 domain-containing protein [Sphingobacteriales bacterium]|nr:MAG: DUF3696 domain-containing protein [Sphingobacteriales bacterium]